MQSGEVVVLKVCWPAGSSGANYSSMLRIPMNKHKTVGVSQVLQCLAGRCYKQVHHFRILWRWQLLATWAVCWTWNLREVQRIGSPSSLHAPLLSLMLWLCRWPKTKNAVWLVNFTHLYNSLFLLPDWGTWMMAVITYNLIITKHWIPVIQTGQEGTVRRLPMTQHMSFSFRFVFAVLGVSSWCFNMVPILCQSWLHLTYF